MVAFLGTPINWQVASNGGWPKPRARRPAAASGRQHPLGRVCCRRGHGDDHVQPRPVGHRRVDDRGRHVDPPSQGAQYPLDQIGQLTGREDRRGQLRPAGRPMNTRPGSLTRISSTSGSSR